MKRTAPVATCALLAVTLLAAACTDDATPAAESGGEAAGKVLGGEISDAMIPLEQLESQAPLAPRQAPSARDVDGEQPEVAGEAAPPQSEEAEPAPEPAAAPAE